MGMYGTAGSQFLIRSYPSVFVGDQTIAFSSALRNATRGMIALNAEGIYYNGELYATFPSTPTTLSSSAEIGILCRNAGSDKCAIKMHAAGIYNTVLPPNAIGSLYQSLLALDSPAVNAWQSQRYWWPFELVLPPIAGELSQTLGAATSAATGAVQVRGAASPTLGAAVAAATGAVQVHSVPAHVAGAGAHSIQSMPAHVAGAGTTIA